VAPTAPGESCASIPATEVAIGREADLPTNSTLSVAPALPSARGEDSDLIFGVEEASFRDGRWHLRGFITGGLILHVAVPRETAVHKGKLFPLRYDPARFRLLPRA